MKNDISNSQDTLDVRDIIARVEELESEIDNMKDAGTSHEMETIEFEALHQLLNEMKGNGGDEQWKGDWYPVTMIRDSYFETAMDELLEDIGEMKSYDKIPSYLKITVDYDALQSDYTSVEYDGVMYWYR